MNLKIKHIKIENFRCFENLETDLWDRTAISGDNENGKTCIASAILWCFTGKDIDNATDFEIVPADKYGKVSPSVELNCMADDKPISFKREYKAKYTRDKNFSTYEIVCYVNGIETGVKKFQDYISKEICDEKIFRVLINPYTFIENCPKEQKELIWQAQRKMLMNMVAKSDIDIAKSDEKWEELVEPLKTYDSIDNYIVLLKQETSKIQKEVTSFADKLEQQQANVVEVDTTKEQAETEISKLEVEIDRINDEIDKAKVSTANEKLKDLQDKISKLNEVRDKLINGYNADLQKFYAEKDKMKVEAEELRKQRDAYISKQVTYAKEVERLKKAEYPETCSACGQKLNPAIINKMKQTDTARITKGNAYVEKARQLAEEKTKEYDALMQKIQQMQEPVYPIIEQDLREQVNELANQPDETQNEEIKAKIATLEEEKKPFIDSIAKYREKLYNIGRNEKCEAIIVELENQHRELNSKLDRLQATSDICKDFIVAKCESFETDINSLFKTVRFELFKKNKTNEEIKETCNMTFNGHEYSDLSASTKLVANLEIVSAFQKFYGVCIPIILDNMESVTADIHSEAQIIEMRVVEELCPECSGKSGRRKPNGLWECEKCHHEWHKKLTIVEE